MVKCEASRGKMQRNAIKDMARPCTPFIKGCAVNDTNTNNPPHMQAHASAADVEHIDLMLINRRMRPPRANLRAHAKLESIHHFHSNGHDPVDGTICVELDVLRPRISRRHCAKPKLESPLEDSNGSSPFSAFSECLAAVTSSAS